MSNKKKRKTRKRAETRTLHFTKTSIEAIGPTGRRQTFYDSKDGDLGLRVNEVGKKSFFWFRTINGRPKFKSLGPWPAVTIEKARAAARELSGAQAELKRTGKLKDNPFTGTRGEWSVKQLFDDYIERGLKNSSINFEGAKENAEYRWSHIADWGTLKLSQVTFEMVVDRHHDIGEEHGRIAANRTMGLLRTMFYFAFRQQKFSGRNPVQGLVFYKEHSRDRSLSEAEIWQFFHALKREPSQDLKDFICCALFTGARKSNIFAMKWAAVNFDNNAWTIAKTKSGNPYTVPLSKEVVNMLRRRRREAEADAQWVFPSETSESGHTVTMDKRWRAFLARTGIKDVTQHDLRRTLATVFTSERVNAPMPVTAKALGHSNTMSVTPIYARATDSAVRAAIDKAAEHIRTAAKTKPKLLTR